MVRVLKQRKKAQKAQDRPAAIAGAHVSQMKRRKGTGCLCPWKKKRGKGGKRKSRSSSITAAQQGGDQRRVQQKRETEREDGDPY